MRLNDSLRTPRSSRVGWCLNDEMEVKLKGEYIRRLKKVLKSKLSGKNSDGYQHLGSVVHALWGWNNQLDQM